MNLQADLKDLVETNSNVVSLYIYGSTVYGTRTPQSDYDMVVIVENKTDPVIAQLEKHGDVNVFSKEEFQTMLNEHEISAIECISLPSQHIIKEAASWDFTLSLPELRKAISSKASNSWVKAKKKFIVEADRNEYVGKKSSWHAIRILDFGYQIATEGKITNFASSNDLLNPIMACSSWEEINEKFRTVYNQTASKFKEVAPKEGTVKPKFKA